MHFQNWDRLDKKNLHYVGRKIPCGNEYEKLGGTIMKIKVIATGCEKCDRLYKILQMP